MIDRRDAVSLNALDSAPRRTVPRSLQRSLQRTVSISASASTPSTRSDETFQDLESFYSRPSARILPWLASDQPEEFELCTVEGPLNVQKRMATGKNELLRPGGYLFCKREAVLYLRTFS